MKSFVCKFFTIAALAFFGGLGMAFADEGVEALSSRTNFTACETTAWGDIPADMTVKEIVEGCGVKSEPDDYQTVKENASEAKLAADRVLAVMTANENVWFEVTNYYGMVGIPASMQLYEIRDGARKTVWDQRDWVRWHVANEFLTNNAALESTLSKWSRFQSFTGEENPLEDMTWISTPRVVIAGGYEWQKTVLADANVFVLHSNGLAVTSSPTEGSFFSIEDLDGSPLMTVKKTADQVLPAQASAVTTDNKTLIVNYAVASAEHPVANVSLKIDADHRVWYEEGDADCPATVTWSGASGNWVARITPKFVTDSIFAYAHYTKQGQTLIEINGVTSSSKGFQCADDPSKFVKIIWNGGNPKLVEAE